MMEFDLKNKVKASLPEFGTKEEICGIFVWEALKQGFPRKTIIKALSTAINYSDPRKVHQNLKNYTT